MLLCLKLSYEWNVIKGALDKYDIYSFISYFIEDLKIKPLPKFLADSVNAFSFYEVFCDSIIFRVSHRLLYNVYIEVDFEKNARNIHISSKVNQSRM